MATAIDAVRAKTQEAEFWLNKIKTITQPDEFYPTVNAFVLAANSVIWVSKFYLSFGEHKKIDEDPKKRQSTLLSDLPYLSSLSSLEIEEKKLFDTWLKTEGTIYKRVDAHPLFQERHYVIHRTGQGFFNHFPIDEIVLSAGSALKANQGIRGLPLGGSGYSFIYTDENDVAHSAYDYCSEYFDMLLEYLKVIQRASYLPVRLFPQLRDKTWADVNLDAFARRDFAEGPNPLLNADFCAQWVDALAREHKTDFTFGGYLEDRAHLWRGHYLASGPQIHLGVDYNVPAGTVVAALADGDVVHIGRDGSFGGWGGLVVIKHDTPPMTGADYAYYGHLRWDDTVRLGQKMHRGEVIGFVGDASQNGQWFPHLHLQCVSAEVFTRATHPEQVDGYAQPPFDTAQFPDPHKLVKF